MYYTYILKSLKTDKFYFGWTNDLKKRLTQHNNAQNRSTKSGIPWKLVFYSAFETEILAKDFERYLKSGSGRAFANKRLLM